jgi:hypothetical protein
VIDKRDLMAHWDEIATDPRLTLDRANEGVAGYKFVTTGSLDKSQLRALETRPGCGASVTIVESVAELPPTRAGKRMRFIGFGATPPAADGHAPTM